MSVTLDPKLIPPSPNPSPPNAEPSNIDISNLDLADPYALDHLPFETRHFIFKKEIERLKIEQHELEAKASTIRAWILRTIHHPFLTALGNRARFVRDESLEEAEQRKSRILNLNVDEQKMLMRAGMAREGRSRRNTTKSRRMSVRTVMMIKSQPAEALPPSPPQSGASDHDIEDEPVDANEDWDEDVYEDIAVPDHSSPFPKVRSAASSMYSDLHVSKFSQGPSNSAISIQLQDYRKNLRSIADQKMKGKGQAKDEGTDTGWGREVMDAYNAKVQSVDNVEHDDFKKQWQKTKETEEKLKATKEENSKLEMIAMLSLDE